MCFAAKDNGKHYGKIDGIIAVAFYVLGLMNTYFWVMNDFGTSIRDNFGTKLYTSFVNVGFHHQTANDWACFIAVIPSNLLPYILLFVIFVVRKEKFSSLGFQKHHNLGASLIGIGAGIVIALFMYSVLFFCRKSNVFSSLQKLNFSVPVLLSNIVLTGLTEELCYRAYIQSYITGLIRNRWIAIIVVGLMFWISHFFNDFLSGPIKIDILLQGIFMVCIHIAFLFLYRKTGNILTAALCHGIYDFMIAPIYF